MLSAYRHISLLILLAALTTVPGCYEEIIIEHENDFDGHFILKLNDIDGYTDLPGKRIFFTIPEDIIEDFSPHVQYSAYNSMIFKGGGLINDTVNDLGRIETGLPYPLVCLQNEKKDTFNIVFTTLPLIHFFTEDEIRDEPKSPGTLYMQYRMPGSGDVGSISFISFAGIEIRGASSMKYGKVSYGLELWKNKQEDDYTTSLLDMRPNEDWVLDAMYIDDLRMRNKLSFDVWKQIATVPANDTSRQFFPGINIRYVELLINNRYLGVYGLGEKVNEQLLGFSDDQLLEGGRIYKAIRWADGSTKFETYHHPPGKSFTWDGWEQIYPKHDTAWVPLDRLRQFVVYSSDSIFKEKVFQYFDADNLVHSLLFLNLIKGNDNAGKNNFLARYRSNSQFFMIPWDIESSWGLAWDRSTVSPVGFLSNNLYDRLMATNAGNFRDQISTRWFHYREGAFSEEQLSEIILSNYNRLATSKAYEREAATWTEFSIDPEEEYEEISSWLTERLDYLDQYYRALE